MFINIEDYDYELPDGSIARYPSAERDGSRLLCYRDGRIDDKSFGDICDVIPGHSLVVFNNTRVIRARLVMNKPTGARIEIFCLEPYEPAGYERSLAAYGEVSWKCIVGNSRKWKDEVLVTGYTHNGAEYTLRASRDSLAGGDSIVRFCWDEHITFGELLEVLGRVPLPPYLGREDTESDINRYQTVYSRVEGSVAAPTAGLHFTEDIMGQIVARGNHISEVTLHVGAGTFLPVKTINAAEHRMHHEVFTVTLRLLEDIGSHIGNITAVGTTTVRTLESLAALGYRLKLTGDPDLDRPVGQWETYAIPEEADTTELINYLSEYLRDNDLPSIQASTGIMIVPGHRFRFVDNLITNFHQPRSTLLLLVSAFIGDDWKRMYRHALDEGYRFLSYGDSSFLERKI